MREGANTTKGLSISHLLFADYTILFFDETRGQVLHIRMICFEAITSLNVNLGKSQVVPIGEVDAIASFLDILCFRLGSLLMNYLGRPMGSHCKSISVRKPILEKMERKLYGWKRLDLSKGRRL